MDSQPDVHDSVASASAEDTEDLFGDFDAQAGYDMLKSHGDCQHADNSAVDLGAAETSGDVCQTVESPTKPASGKYRPVGFGPAAKKFRYNPDGGRPFEFKKLPCLQGRHLEEPILLPFLGSADMASVGCDEAQFTLVRFAYRESWVSQACIGRVCGGPVIDFAIKQVRSELMKALLSAAAAKRAEKTLPAASCRNHLRMLTDSEDEVDDTGDLDLEADSPDTIPVHEIKYYGLLFPAARVKKVMYVEGSSKVCESMCAAVLDACAANLEKNTSTVADRPEPALEKARPLAKTPDQDKIQWMAHSNTFQVTYIDEQGKKRRSISGLSVPTRTKDKKRPLVGSPYRRLYASAYLRAKTNWNLFDRSKADRFLIADELKGVQPLVHAVSIE